MLFGHFGRWIFSRLFTVCVVLMIVPVQVESGIYKMMAEAMMHHIMKGGGGGGDDYGSKGISFGIRSKGMTAIIPVPLPIPLFTKDSGGGGKGGGETVKYIPVPVPAGDKGWWR